MKNLLALTTFTSTILLAIPLGKFISKLVNHKDMEHETKNTNIEEFDLSLRNYHPNKGE